MKIKICTCKHCRAAKSRENRNTKKRIKRYLNRLRRRDTDKVFNWYWA
jgi:hypothetical protein